MFVSAPIQSGVRVSPAARRATLSTNWSVNAALNTLIHRM